MRVHFHAYKTLASSVTMGAECVVHTAKGPTKIPVDDVSVHWFLDMDPPKHQFCHLTLAQAMARLREGHHISAASFYDDVFQVTRYLNDGSNVVLPDPSHSEQAFYVGCSLQDLAPSSPPSTNSIWKTVAATLSSQQPSMTNPVGALAQAPPPAKLKSFLVAGPASLSGSHSNASAPTPGQWRLIFVPTGKP